MSYSDSESSSGSDAQLDEMCGNYELNNLFGKDEKDERHKENTVIFIIDHIVENLYNCYTRDEFENNLRSAVEKKDADGNLIEDEIVCIRKPGTGRRLLYEPVVREPISSVWLDKSVYAYQDSTKFFVYERGEFFLATDSNYVGSFHGTPYTIYSVIPIERDNFFDIPIQQIKQEMRDEINRVGKDELEKRIIKNLSSRRRKRIWIFGEQFKDLLDTGFLIENEDFTEIPSELYEGQDITNLKIVSCPNLISVPNIVGIKELEINTCESLREIANIEGLEMLTVAECKIIENIPNIVGLEKLIIESCPNVWNIPEIQSLKLLNCINCESLREIPRLRNLRKLNIEESKIIEIPNSQKLTYLNCRRCPNITQIQNFRSLTYLECSATQLRRLPDFPVLTELVCKGCFNLTSLPELRLLENLTCSESAIEILPNFDKLNYLDCIGCNLLLTIPRFSELKWLDCSKCRMIEAIPNIYGLEHLECNDCRFLVTIPVIDGLKVLKCNNCPRATVPNIRGLEELECHGTPGCNELNEGHSDSESELSPRVLDFD